MAITYIVGNPGSGKTFFGVKILYDYFIKENKPNFLDKILKKNDKKDDKDFVVAYTNINQFNFESSDKIKKFEYDKFYEKISLVYNSYVFEKADDNKLIELLKDLDLYKALFVIDEIHNFFNNADDVLVWWLTYHRHLYQELYFITQSLSLVAPCYKNVAEFFYKASDSSHRLFSKKFRYSQYTTANLYKKDLIKKIHIDFDEKIFNLYHSGNNGLGKSAVKKFFLIAFVLFIFCFIIFKVIMSVFFTPDTQNIKQPENKISSQAQNSPKNDLSQYVKNFNQNLENKERLPSYYFVFTCSYSYCIFENSINEYDRDLIFKLIYDTRILYRSARQLTSGLIKYSFLLENDVFKPLKIEYKGKTDEKNSDNSIFAGFGSQSSNR